MYLKFVNENGEVFRYNEVKKRIIIAKAVSFNPFSNQKIKIEADPKHKISIDITHDIKLLNQIYMTEFREFSARFHTVFERALFFISVPQQKTGNILVLFGDLYLDLESGQFYSVPIINSTVLLQNKRPVETPFFYRT